MHHAILLAALLPCAAAHDGSHDVEKISLGKIGKAMQTFDNSLIHGMQRMDRKMDQKIDRETAKAQQIINQTMRNPAKEMGKIGINVTYQSDNITFGPGGKVHEKETTCVEGECKTRIENAHIVGVNSTEGLRYSDLGSGKCLVGGNGDDPKHEYIGELGVKQCEEHCTQKQNCFGYSASASNNCLLWTQGPLKGGGYGWGEAKCMVKEPAPQPAKVAQAAEQRVEQRAGQRAEQRAKAKAEEEVKVEQDRAKAKEEAEAKAEQAKADAISKKERTAKAQAAADAKKEHAAKLQAKKAAQADKESLAKAAQAAKAEKDAQKALLHSDPHAVLEPGPVVLKHPPVSASHPATAELLAKSSSDTTVPTNVIQLSLNITAALIGLLMGSGVAVFCFLRSTSTEGEYFLLSA